MKNLFYKGAIDKRNGKALWTFLKNHYTYHTMNSWNGLKSIANNVKIYNLNLEGDKWLAYSLLSDGCYDVVNDCILNWEEEHKGYDIGFNGRSDGYLVLTQSHSVNNVLPRWIIDNDSYDDFKQTCKDYYGSVKEALPDLLEYVELVQSFDKLCDEIRDYVNNLSLTNKEDLLKNEVEEFLDWFNEQYANDREMWNIQPLEYKDGKVITTEVYKSRSLGEALDNHLKAFTNSDSMVQVSSLIHNDIRYLEFKI